VRLRLCFASVFSEMQDAYILRVSNVERHDESAVQHHRSQSRQDSGDIHRIFFTMNNVAITIVAKYALCSELNIINIFAASSSEFSLESNL